GVRIREHLPRIEAALAALYDYADAVIAARERDPRDDLVTSLVKSQADDGGLTGAGLTGAGLTGAGLTRAELRDALVLLIFGGFDIEAGTTIHLFCESAGTDTAQAGTGQAGTGQAGTGQAGGGDFDITATGRPPHFGFGGGIHYCLGHYVARADMATALTVLAGRLGDPRPAGE